MKIRNFFIVFCLSLMSQAMYGQFDDPFLSKYSFYKSFQSSKADVYSNIDGSPYFNSDFIEGEFYLQDTVKIKLPIRYNIYTDQMEYQSKGVNYVVGDPESVKKVILAGSVFVYQPNIQKGGYYEIIINGKCTLAHKKVVKFKPEEGPKAIVGVNTPAQFIRKTDIVYLVINSQAYKIKNLKSVLTAMQDKKTLIDSFIKQEKINNLRQDNLNKIVNYYNSLK